MNRGSRIKNFLTGLAPAGRERWVGRAVTAVVIGGLFLGAAGHGLGTRLVNILVFFALMAAVYAAGAALHNRAVARR